MLPATYLIIACCTAACAGAFALRTREVLTFAGWVPPTLSVAALAAFPMTIVSTLYFAASRHAGGVGLAPWITDSWRSFGVLLPLVWYGAWFMVRRRRLIGVRRPAARWFVGLTFVAISLASFCDTALFFVFANAGRPVEYARVRSPDGTRVAILRRSNFRDVSWQLVGQSRGRARVFARELGSATDFSGSLEPPRVVWAADGSHVAMWSGRQPRAAWDFAAMREIRLETEAFQLAPPPELAPRDRLALCALLLEEGFEGTALLSGASTAGDLETVRVLTELGVDVDASYNGSRPLDVAARNGHHDVVRFLLAHGSRPDADTPSWTSPLIGAAGNGHRAVVTMLLDHGAEVDRSTTFGNTALLIAAWHGHPAIVRLLLDRGASPEIRNHRGSSALDLALEREHGEVATLLRDTRGS